jgi:putative sigma-54 modulation protein
MLHITDITGIKYEVDEQTRKYVTKRIGRLERYLPRHARKSAKAEVKLKQIDKSHGNKYEVEVLLFVPDKKLLAKDESANILAAVDIVEAKLAGQLRRYKTETIPHIGKGRILSRFKRSYAREEQ